MTQLVLASSSPYRKELLHRLRLSFDCASPDIDESPHNNESALNLVKRLAEQKAQALAERFPNALLIGSDQVAVINGKILGKPGNFANAFEQLTASSGNTVEFLTGLALYNSGTNRLQSHVEPYRVNFRQLSSAEIERYIKAEEPYACAGSFKSEGLGITLFESQEGADPNSLIGLPLIALCEMLRKEGLNLP